MNRATAAASGAVEIRPLSGDDAPAFWALRLRGLREHPEAFGRSFEEELATPPAEVRARISNPPEGFVLGAWRGGDLVSIVGVRRFGPTKQRHKAMLWGVYVVPEARGRGLARRLLEEAIAAARDLPGLEQLQLSANADGFARHLYASLGFVPFGLEHRAFKLVDGAYVDEEHMVYRLDRPADPVPPSGPTPTTKSG